MPSLEQYLSDGSSNECTKSYERQDPQGSASFIGLFLLALFIWRLLILYSSLVRKWDHES